MSTAFGDFLTGPASAWSVAAGLTGPIFTFGLIEGQVQSAEAATRGAVANYQQVIFNAFRETNDALVGTVKRRAESAAQTKRVAALREYARLSRLRFDNGYAGYLEVLYAENELFSAELTAVSFAGERLHAGRQRLQRGRRRLGGRGGEARADRRALRRRRAGTSPRETRSLSSRAARSSRYC